MSCQYHQRPQHIGTLKLKTTSYCDLRRKFRIRFGRVPIPRFCVRALTLIQVWERTTAMSYDPSHENDSRAREPVVSLDDKAHALLAYIAKTPAFQTNKEPDYGNYRHMGATISAAILQAGLNWETTVQPRIGRLRTQFPQAETTSGFLRLLTQRGHVDVLTAGRTTRNRNESLGSHISYFPRKWRRRRNLKNWLLQAGNDVRLLALHGVGEKTVDFLKILVRIPTNAVDRHLNGFLAAAGVEASGYRETHDIIDRAADLGGIDRIVFDFSIWRYMAEKRKVQNRRQTLPCTS